MVTVRTLILDDEVLTKASSQNASKPVLPSGEASSNAGSNRSPFHRVKANLKQIITGLILAFIGQGVFRLWRS
jgi:hypothetical protein